MENNEIIPLEFVKQEKIKITDGLFDGETIDPPMDNVRLAGQLMDIYILMRDGIWRTLREIEVQTGNKYLSSSISANLRNLKKPQFGSHTLNKKPRGDRKDGLWEYRIVPNPQIKITFAEVV